MSKVDNREASLYKVDKLDITLSKVDNLDSKMSNVELKIFYELDTLDQLDSIDGRV